jgi:hypothetical protein
MYTSFINLNDGDFVFVRLHDPTTNFSLGGTVTKKEVAKHLNKHLDKTTDPHKIQVSEVLIHNRDL